MENFKDKKTDDILEKLVHINRITKVVKGGRRFGFSALVVVGNQAGKIGVAHAKAKQVPDAIKKANEVARRKLIHIPLREGRTIHHDVKAKEVPEAVRKATENAKNKMVRVHLKENRTIHHDVVGRFGAGTVILRSAAPGTGIIAGGPMRALFESLGIKDIVAKSTGSSNPHNMIKATFNAFQASESPKSIAAKRTKKINEITMSKQNNKK